MKDTNTKPDPPKARIKMHIKGWLNSLASDLDLMLNDICHGSFPYTRPVGLSISAPQPRRPVRSLGEDPILEQYITSAASLDGDDDEASSDAFADRSRSDSSSDGEFFSMDEEQNSDPTRLCSDRDSPILFSLGAPPCDPGGEGDEGREGPPPTLTLEERLRKTHPLWYLPYIHRKEASQLLADHQSGIFLVRQASERDKMVLTLRTGPAPNVEHFLIETVFKGLRLKGCIRCFKDVTKLIEYYSNVQDDLPVKLTLPQVITMAQTSHELTSLTLLGQDFWTSPISRQPPMMRTTYHTSVSSYKTRNTHQGTDIIPQAHNNKLRQSPNKQNGGVHAMNRAPSFEAVNQKKFSYSQLPPEPNLAPNQQVCNGSTPLHETVEVQTAQIVHSSSTLFNHSGERSAFKQPSIQPVPLVNQPGTKPGQYSDYENISGPFFFRPIVHSETESAGDSTPVQLHNSHKFTAHNPLYNADCLSEKSADYIDSSFFVDLDKSTCDSVRTPLSTEHVEEHRKVLREQVVVPGHRTKEPVVFTFNIQPSTPTEAPKPATVSTLHVPISPHRTVSSFSPASSQYSSPAYIEPFDSLIGKVEGATHTSAVMRVSNLSRITNGHYSHSLEVKPPIAPSRVDRHEELRSNTLPKPKQDSPRFQSTPKPVCSTGPSQKGAGPPQSPRKAPPAFLRCHSERSLQSHVDRRHDSRARSLPREVQNLPKDYQRKLYKRLQPVIEPSVPSRKSVSNPPCPASTFHYDIPNGYNDPQTKSKTPRWSEILGEFEDLEVLLSDAVASEKVQPPMTLRRFPRAQSQTSLCSTHTSFSETCTVDDVLNNVSPELTLRPIKPLTAKNLQRMSDYDNLHLRGPSSRRTMVSSVGTAYCQPWDSNLIQDLMTIGSVAEQGKFPTPTQSHVDQNNRDSFISRQSVLTEYSLFNESESGRAPSENSFDMRPETHEDSGPANQGEAVRVQLSDDEGMEDDQNVGQVRLQRDMIPVFASPGKKPGTATRQRMSLPGIRVQDYVSDLAQNRATTFGKTVDNFIRCTTEGTESNPNVVIRNVRQFMNGIKNYLVQNGEAALNELIEHERKQLGKNEFLNIDALIEGALHKCVVKPLERHILNLFIEQYKDNGSLHNMKNNIEYARTKSLYELGIKPELMAPEPQNLEKIKHSLHKMQKAYSPMKKLQHLLGATSEIYNMIQELEDSETASSTNSTVSLGADDFLPMFIFVLVQCGMVSAEIEADYMWGLLHPCILAGEGGYHLTILSSAVHVLKNLKQTMESTNESPRLPSLGDLQGFMKIIIPDEKNHSIITKILPVRPNMTTKDVCNMIAHRFKVTNPQDHGLYMLISGLGTEDRLSDTESPQSFKEGILNSGRECVFAYKRNNAKFVWPVIFKS